jgi:hypothetical protein
LSQVRDAANALITSLRFDTDTRTIYLQRVCANLKYTQARNQRARLSHSKTRRRHLRAQGLFTSQMHSCIPP